VDKTDQVTLPIDVAQFVVQLVAQGDFPSVNEAVSSAVRTMRDHEQARREKLETLRRDIMIGTEQIERGEVSNATADDIIAAGRRELARRRGEA
jgi:antitoxin ParD1/3/4